jgi:hypothetical protein
LQSWVCSTAPSYSSTCDPIPPMQGTMIKWSRNGGIGDKEE